MMSAFKHALAVPTSVVSLMLSSAEQAAAGGIGLQEFRLQTRQARARSAPVRPVVTGPYSKSE